MNVKDLCVSGTKDKRGVTTQRVSLKRNGKILQDVWKVVNGITGRRTIEQALTERGERGIRIGDLAYRKGFLELGMLKGNAFVITLRWVIRNYRSLSFRPFFRNVKADSLETIDRAMTSLKEDGFINYYGRSPLCTPVSLLTLTCRNAAIRDIIHSYTFHWFGTFAI